MESMFGITIATFLQTAGLLGVIGVVFAESGLLIGFFLPGDSLLFTAGFFASQGFFSPLLLLIGCFGAAVVGDNVGYAFGSHTGKKIFNRDHSFFFHKDHIERARLFYEEHGPKTIILARFIPVVRTFAPIIAGVGQMNYRLFLIYNVLGGALWSFCLLGLGYILGFAVPHADQYLTPIILLIVAVSFLPAIIHLCRKVF